MQSAHGVFLPLPGLVVIIGILRDLGANISLRQPSMRTHLAGQVVQSCRKRCIQDCLLGPRSEITHEVLEKRQGSVRPFFIVHISNGLGALEGEDAMRQHLDGIAIAELSGVGLGQ